MSDTIWDGMGISRERYVSLMDRAIDLFNAEKKHSGTATAVYGMVREELPDADEGRITVVFGMIMQNLGSMRVGSQLGNFITKVTVMHKLAGGSAERIATLFAAAMSNLCDLVNDLQQLREPDAEGPGGDGEGDATIN